MVYNHLSSNGLRCWGFSFGCNIVYFRQEYILEFFIREPIPNYLEWVFAFCGSLATLLQSEAAGPIRPSNLRSICSVSLGLIGGDYNERAQDHADRLRLAFGRYCRGRGVVDL